MSFKRPMLLNTPYIWNVLWMHHMCEIQHQRSTDRLSFCVLITTDALISLQGERFYRLEKWWNSKELLEGVVVSTVVYRPTWSTGMLTISSFTFVCLHASIFIDIDYIGSFSYLIWKKLMFLLKTKNIVCP